MAKVIYYCNPLDRSDTREIEFHGSINGSLKKIGIEKKPLCLIINGEMPKEIDLDYILMENDRLEIHIPVEGGGGGLSAIISIVTVAAMIAVGPGGWAIAIGIAGALASGAVAKKEAPKITANQDNSVMTPSKRVDNPENERRPEQAIPIPVGSVRFYGDAYTNPIIKQLRLIDSNASYNAVGVWYYDYLSMTISYGIGDLDIFNRRVSGNQFDDIRDNYGYSEMNKDGPDTAGLIDSIIPPFYQDYISTTDAIEFPVYVENKSNPVYSNANETRDTVPPTDLSDSNWSLFESQPNQDIFMFLARGWSRLIPNTANPTYIQIQYKQKGATNWISPPLGTRFEIGFVTMNNNDMFCSVFRVPAHPSIDVSVGYSVRIRKATLDSVDRTNDRVNNIKIEYPVFFSSESYEDQNDLRLTRVPLNIEGVYISSNFQDIGTQQNAFSAMVEASCYYFDFLNEEWVWGKTRNPAWWFLFFVRGGYKNLESWGSDTWPYSPTRGWQNYSGHSGNQELLFGGGYKNEEIDLEKLKDWALFCDENNLFIDGAMREEGNLAEALEKIANVGRGSVVYDKGLISVIYEDKNQIPVTMFGMGNIISGSFQSSYSGKINASKIEVIYNNRENDFEQERITVNIPFVEDNNISQEIGLEYITDPDMAQREANILAARQFFQTRNYSWSTDHEGFLARRGDLVFLSHDATQFGYSGRVVRFLLSDDGNIIGLEGTSQIDKDVSWIMVRLPNSEMVTLPCSYIDEMIYFNEEFSLINGPSHIRDQKRNQENPLSRFPNTTADDFVYIADIKETTGKIVRIASVETNEDHIFNYTAIDEDPAMWAFEQGVVIDPESVNDSIGIIEVTDCSVCYLGGGDVELLFNGSDDCLFMFINETTGQPIEINGRFSTSEKRAKLELNENEEVTIKIVPLSINEKVQSRSFKVTLWQA